MEVCTGVNSVTLTTAGNRGSVVGWTATSGGVTTAINDTTSQYTATNLTATTLYKALIQNGQSCAVDTTSGSTVLVDPRSVGGTLNPASLSFCEGQNKDALIQLSGDTGSLVNWQSSTDGINWTSFVPADTASEYNVEGVTVSSDFRVIVQSGVCPPDSSTIATVSSSPTGHVCAGGYCCLLQYACKSPCGHHHRDELCLEQYGHLDGSGQ